jgi:hypothetical protein
VIAGDVDDRSNRDARRVHRTDEVADSLLRRALVGRSREQDTPRREVGVTGPHLLPGDDPFVTVAFGASAERGQIAPGVGFAEELAPELFTAQQLG